MCGEECEFFPEYQFTPALHSHRLCEGVRGKQNTGAIDSFALFFSSHVTICERKNCVFVLSSFAFSITRITESSEWQTSAPGAVIGDGDPKYQFQ